MNDVNTIVLRRKLGVVLRPAETDAFGDLDLGILAALTENVADLGFMLAPDALRALSHTSLLYVETFHRWLTAELAALVGRRDYRPMYPNFPRQVLAASDAELYFNALFHYFGDAVGLRIMPQYDAEPRASLRDFRPLKTVRLLPESERRGLLAEILAQRNSPSDLDKQDIQRLFVCNFDPGTSFPNRENLAVLLACLRGDPHRTKTYARFVTTSTDVLRVAVALSGGDLSLADDSNFAKFSRADRRFLLYLLNRFQPVAAAEDMMRFREKWKRLGERLHPGEYAEMFPNAVEAFRIIRTEGAPTFYSKVEKSLHALDARAALALLAQRPGELARALDRMLRVFPDDHAVVIDGFRAVAPQVAPNVLWQVMAHFRGRQSLEHSERAFFPKGSTTRVLEGPALPSLSRDLCLQVSSAVLEALRQRVATLPSLGKVYIDPVCRGLVVPTGGRSASAQLRTVGRGSRFPIDTDTLRFFMWWRNQPDGRVDLDLSAIVFDAKWQPLGQVSWTRLREFSTSVIGAVEGVHSGDVTSAPHGASEFLDINIDSLRPGAAYVAMAVFSYTGQKFNELQGALAGFMCRSGPPQEGEIYEAPTVHTRFLLTTPATSVCPLVYDVKNRQVIWADLALHKEARCLSVCSSWQSVAKACRAIAAYHATRPTLHDVYALHRMARGAPADSRETADFVVAEDGDVSPFDAAKLMGDYL